MASWIPTLRMMPCLLKLTTMDMVDAPVQSPCPKKEKTRGCGGSRERYYNNVAKSTIFYTYMPEKPPQEDPSETDQRRIAFYIQDRLTIWLDIDDVAWAVRFLYVQNMLNGTPLVQPDSTEPPGVTANGPSHDAASRGDGEESCTTD